MTSRARPSREHGSTPGPLARPRASSGLRQGDGVFETLRTYDGRPFLLDPHLSRLRAGARALGLAGVPSVTALRAACLRTLAASRDLGPERDWVLRPALFAEAGRAALEVTAEAVPPGPEGSAGLVVGRSEYRHAGRLLTPPGSREPVKWLARGPLAHALRVARRRGWDEAILADERGRFVEGTRSNLLAVVDGTLLAPGPESFALAGITREVVLRDARHRRIPVVTRPIAPRELRRASEVAVTSSLLGVAAVARFVGLWSRTGRPEDGVLATLAGDYRERVLRGR